VRTVRNIAIIALLALGVAFLPGGGNAAQAVTTTLLLAFLVTIGFGAYQIYRQNRLTFDSLPDQRRGVLLGAVGVLVLMVAGAQEMLDGGGGGALLWVMLTALAVLAIVSVWAEAQRY
jgi:hypothetical protein